MTEVLDLPPDGQIERYLNLAAEARNHARSPYAGLFIAIPPDPRTIMIEQLAIIYAIVGVLLFLVALVSGLYVVLASLNGLIVRTAYARRLSIPSSYSWHCGGRNPPQPEIPAVMIEDNGYAVLRTDNAHYEIKRTARAMNRNVPRAKAAYEPAPDMTASQNEAVTRELILAA